MGTHKEPDLVLTLGELLNKLELALPGVTTPTTHPSYAEIITLRQQFGRALEDIHCKLYLGGGYSFLVYNLNTYIIINISI